MHVTTGTSCFLAFATSLHNAHHLCCEYIITVLFPEPGTASFPLYHYSCMHPHETLYSNFQLLNLLLTCSSALLPAGQARPIFPFTAVIGQEEMKLALILNVIDPKIGGVMIMGDRGTGKTTTIRALADLLPQVPVVAKDPFNSGAVQVC
jgi:hypothetical protein